MWLLRRNAVLLLSTVVMFLASYHAEDALGKERQQPQTQVRDDEPASRRVKSVETALRGELLASMLTDLLGVAISPLIGVVVIGVHGYFWGNLPPEELSWFHSPAFWIPALLVLLIVLLKDTIGAIDPVSKKFVDAAEIIENKLSGLIAAPVILAVMIDRFEGALHEAGLLTGIYPAFEPLASADPMLAASVAGNISYGLGAGAIGIFGTIMFAVVWLASHTINVLILLNPVPFVDWMLKVFRLSVLGFIFAVASLGPLPGILASLLVLLFCIAIAGWSFRLLVFGSVFSWDVLTFASRRTYVKPEVGALRAFTSHGLTGVPMRTYGLLKRTTEGILQFEYRPWLIRASKVAKLESKHDAFEIGQGLTHPSLIEKRDDGHLIWLRFPPRYRGKEEALKNALGLAAIRDVSILRGFKAAWRWLRGICDASPVVTPAVSTSDRTIGAP